MADYSSLNLDTSLRSINSPVFVYGQSSYDFDSSTERSSVDTSVIQDQSITNAKIVSLTADKITAGTISSGIIYAGTISGTQIAAGTIAANIGYLGTISANQLNAGTINASNIAVINIDADQINTGELNASLVKIENLDGVTNAAGSTVINGGKITTGTIDASVVTVSNLNANNINAGTLTGRTVRTSSSSTRVEMTDSSNEMGVYSSGTKIIQVDEGGIWLRQDNVIGMGGTDSSGQRSQVYHSSSVAGLHLDSDDSIYLDTGTRINGALQVVGGINASDYTVYAIKMANFNEQSSRPNDDDGIWYYKSGGSYAFRSRMEGGNWSFDQTSV